MNKKILALAMAMLMLASALGACSSQPQDQSPAVSGGTEPSGSGNSGSSPSGEPAGEIVRESPALQAMVSAGTIPELEQRLPVEADRYVDADRTPDSPQYGGTLRRNNGNLWDYGPFCEEPLFRLTDDGGIVPNVAKGYELSADGLTYTISLREGMKWSDGTPFTAEDCVFYYNYMLITGVDWETGAVTSSYNGNYYNWYKSADPADGILKPAIVTMVDPTTFTIQLLSPKPSLLHAIAIDNKWMYAPKEWYKDIVAFDSATPHWSGVEDIALVGGAGLVDLTEEQAVANAAAKNSLYTFDNYQSLGKELGYEYWKYLGRPTLRAWNNTSPLTETTLVFERNPYFWKVDTQGRQLPYIDTVEMVSMDASLYAQELIAGNLDMCAVELADYPTVKASEASGNFTIKRNIQPNWTTCGVELNMTYKDQQYADLFKEIDFRHALSICANRTEMNEILFNGIAEPAQAAAPEGTAQYSAEASQKWVEYDVDGANALLDGIDMISSELNADGYRTFTDGANAGQPITLYMETHALRPDTSQSVALLIQYYKAVGIQVVEVTNENRANRNQKIFAGNEVMVNLEENINVFNPAIRPDRLGANRNLNTWLGKYSLEFKDALTPDPGTPVAEVVNLTTELLSATTEEAWEAAGDKLLQNHFENTWYIGYLRNPNKFTGLSNKVKNYDESTLSCDELRFYGNNKPYTWYIEE